MISVCIATHNGEAYIKEELLSILPQLGSDDEVIISDDGSTDKTMEIIESLEDNRIKIYKTVSPKGKRMSVYVTKNFENALKHASGDIVFIADQDDVWLPNKVLVCTKTLENCSAVLHNLECVDAQLQPLGYTWYNENLKFRPHNYLMLSGKHMGCGLAFRREMLKTILPFPQKLCIHDFWIGMISELKGELKYIDQPLILYRIHSSNTSRISKKNSLYFKVYYRIYTMFHCVLRCLFK